MAIEGQVRQGDVLLNPRKIPKEAKPAPRDKDPRGIVLAHGETSGHAHAIAATAAKLYAHEEGRYLAIGGKGAVLRHQTPSLQPTGDHGYIHLKPGQVEVVIQREWVDEEIQTVAD